MSMYTRDDLMSWNVVPWVVGNRMVTENRRSFGYDDHRFLIDYMGDMHPYKVSKKSSQIGETVAELFDDFHLAIHRKMNVIHTLHTNDVLKGFVQPKVNPIIAFNPAIAQHLTIDSQGLKQFRDNFVYFRGANAESQAISISADVLKIDEKDRSDAHVVEMFQSRLDFSPYKWVREFSNPSAIGFGVDETYSRSDQRHWFVRCHHCGHYMYMDFLMGDDYNHYVNQEHELFACGKCHKELSDADRTNGEWVAKWPTRDKLHGYWFSQMMAPWFTAGEIVDKFQHSSTEFFHNFVLGKAYTPADLLIDRETIVRALRPGKPRQRGLVMGSDIGKPHWYWIGSAEGLLKWGRAVDWRELEYLFNFYRCDAWVMDSMPEFTQVQQMLTKYPGKAFACQFNRDRAAQGIVRWQTGDKRGFVYVDRTKMIDRLVTELNNGDIKLYGNESDAAEFIAHAGAMYRAIEQDQKGNLKIDWLTKEGKPDHLVFGLIYWRVALEKAFSGVGAGVVETQLIHKPTVPTVGRDGKITVDFNVSQSLKQAEQQRTR